MFVLFWDGRPIGLAETEEQVRDIKQWFVDDGSDRHRASMFRAVEVPDGVFDPTGPKTYIVGWTRFFPYSKKNTRESLQLFLTFDPKHNKAPFLNLEYVGRKWFMWGDFEATSMDEARELAMEAAYATYDMARQFGSKNVHWNGEDYIDLDSPFITTKRKQDVEDAE